MTEYLEILYKESNLIAPIKSINKLLYYEENSFITASRDSSIKIWNNNEESNTYALKANLKGHVDWVNDLCLNKDKTLLFSASNDLNVNIWKLRGFTTNNDEPVEIYPINSINNIFTDYIKSISYNDYRKTLFTGGLDSNICAFDISYSTKTNLNIGNNNIIYKGNDKSIYSISSNVNGNILCASVYENNIICLDTRSKDIIFNLNRHDKPVRKVVLSSEGDMLLSGSSDKTVNLWDMRNPNKIIKCWDHYAGSVTDIKPINGFREFISSDITGNMYLTDIFNGNFSFIDNNSEMITSIDVNNNLDIICSTTNNSLYQYSIFKGNKQQVNKNDSKSNKYSIDKEKHKILKTTLKAFKMKFKEDEVVAYTILKNKIYLLYENKRHEVILFNIVKMSKVHIFYQSDMKSTYENIIMKFDNTPCKSWFTIDLKLGCLAFKFNNDIYNNRGNYNLNYFENIKDLTSNFTKLDSREATEVKCLLINNDKISNTTNIGPRANINEKKLSIGYLFVFDIIQAFCNLSSQSQSFNNKKMADSKNFLELNFYNFKKFLATKIKQKNSMIVSTPDQDNNTKQDLKNYYLNYQNIELICSKNNNKLFICLPQNPTGFNNTSNEEKMFNYNLLPSFIKDIIPENSFSNSLPNFNFSNETNAKTGYKFDLIISNKYQDFHKLQASKNDEDEVEASYDVTVAKFKEWILDKYISNEKFKAKIQAELLKLDPEIASKVKEKYKSNSKILNNYLDLEVNEELIIRNNNLKLGDIKKLFPDETLRLIMRYSTTNTLVERGII